MHNSKAHQVDGVGAAAGIEYGGPGSTEDGSKPVADLSLRRLVAKGEEDHVRHHVPVQVQKALLAQALLQRVDDALLVNDPDARNARDLSNILIPVHCQLVMSEQGAGQHETQAACINIKRKHAATQSVVLCSNCSTDARGITFWSET